MSYDRCYGLYRMFRVRIVNLFFLSHAAAEYIPCGALIQVHLGIVNATVGRTAVYILSYSAVTYISA